MARRYRNFKRIHITPTTAKKLVELFVDKVFEHHFRECFYQDASFVGKPKARGNLPCYHETSGVLNIARLIEASIHIGKRRAYFDLPDHQDELMETFAGRLRQFAENGYRDEPYHEDRKKVYNPLLKRTGQAFFRIADQVEWWGNRGPLHRLAECAYELD